MLLRSSQQQKQEHTCLVGGDALCGVHDLGKEIVLYQLKQLDKTLVHVGCAVDDLKALAVYHFVHRGLDEFRESLNLQMRYNAVY